MEPKIEQPKQYTPEEIAQLEKSRTISDAELLKGGAEYSVNEKGEKENLLIHEEQNARIIAEYESDPKIQEKELFKTLEKTFGKSISSLSERDVQLREASIETIKSIATNSEKKLYATLLIGNDKWSGKEIVDFRLWNQRPQMSHRVNGVGLAGREHFHPDWGLNYRIGLAQSSSITKTEAEELIKDLLAKQTRTYPPADHVKSGDLFEYEIEPRNRN